MAAPPSEAATIPSQSKQTIQKDARRKERLVALQKTLVETAVKVKMLVREIVQNRSAHAETIEITLIQTTISRRAQAQIHVLITRVLLTPVKWQD